MQISALKIKTGNIQAQQHFYSEQLGLPSQTTGDELRIRIGSSELIFTQQTDFTGRYHFAFDIPNNQFQNATQWLKQHTALASDANGNTRFEAGEWNADNVYFYDPQGNILELIARHELENASNNTFGPDSLLHISEIGLASQNVPKMIEWFANTLEVGTYKSISDSFAPIGNATGLVIAVQENRIWFPDTGIPAQIMPTELTIHGEQTITHNIPNTSYIVHVRPQHKEDV
jgi:catechol 2,3-dioxygenase-like lactoylglutathione lyase family enzyme